MKKILLVFAFIVAVQVAHAQDATFKQDVMKMMELSGAAGQYEAAIGQILKSMPDDKKEALRVDLLESIKILQDKMALIYMDEFTHEDIKDMIKYYESPAGKKFAAKSGILFEKSQIAAAEWSVDLQKIAEKHRIK